MEGHFDIDVGKIDVDVGKKAFHVGKNITHVGKNVIHVGNLLKSNLSLRQTLHNLNKSKELNSVFQLLVH
jgi:hypothetical protein